MPFKSDAQRKYLYAKHPEVAKEFAEHSPKGKLPKKKGKDKGPALKGLKKAIG